MVYGIADAHGLESFQLFTPGGRMDSFAMDPQAASMMILRAQANRHRHAVVYQAELPIDSIKEINELMDEGKYTEALLKLKADATDIKLARIPGAEKSWNLIPNPDLDPYS